MSINYTKVTDIVRDYAPRLFVDATVKRQEFFSLVQQEPLTDSTGIKWEVKTEGSTSAGTFAEGGTFPAADEFEDATAELDWGQYVATLKITGKAMDVLEKNSSGEFIANYFQQQTQDSIAELIDEVNSDMLGGANTNGVTGITAAIDDGNTYAGIDRSTATYWRCYVNDNGGSGRALSTSLMDDVHATIIDTNAGNYDLIVTSQTQWDKFVALTSGAGSSTLTANVDGAGPVSQVFNLGFTAANYKGRPVIAIPGYTSGRMDFVELGGLRYRELRELRVSEMRRINDDYHWDITWKGQMYLRNPKKQAASIQDLN